MNTPVRIWLELAHHEAFRVGGWAYVRQDAGNVTGAAGGERRIQFEAAVLPACAAALRDLGPGTAVELRTSSQQLLAIPPRVAAAEAGKDAPSENLERWAQVATAIRRVELRVIPQELTPGTPNAFAAAWADLARERAKEKGAFEAAIPKPNLAKAGV